MKSLLALLATTALILSTGCISVKRDAAETTTTRTSVAPVGSVTTSTTTY